MEKRLYRSRSNRLIWGVCGGLANYFDLDPVIVRIIFVLLIFASGLGILAYIIMAIVVPLEDSKASQPGEAVRENIEEMREAATGLRRELRSTFGSGSEHSEEVTTHQRRRNTLGIIVIVIGVLALLGSLNLLWWGWSKFWPLIIIAIGILLIVTPRRGRHV